MTKIAG